MFGGPIAYAGRVTIHPDHPFVPSDDQKDPLRRLRGRLAAPVTVWTTQQGADRCGLTVSSVLIADGEPARVIGLIDPDSALWEADPQTIVINVLAGQHRFLADAFAGTAPAPGGPFTLGEWSETAWGPALDGTSGWLGVRVEGQSRDVGWRILVEAVIEHVEVGSSDPLVHLRGRYLNPG